MTPELQQLTDEALLNISAHIKFIESILARHSPPSEVVDKVRKQTEAITARQHDQRLYLAVIGEFSSGKSTLINSLLRDRLLKSETRVTTASETRIQYGKELAIEVTSFDRPEEKFTLRESQEFVRTVSWLPGLASTVREIIPQVTAENQLVGKVGRVTISHPCEFLVGGIVIVDTPGINATYSEHAHVTQRVVSEESDLALVTIDATVPGTRVLFDYLNKYLKPYLHRCVFIVTKFDRIAAEGA